MTDVLPQHDLSTATANLGRQMTSFYNHPQCPLAAPSAIIDPTATFEDDLTRIWHHSVILQNVRFGKQCSVGSHAEIGRESRIGDHSRIGSLTFLPSKSFVGQYVFIGPHVMCCDDDMPRVPQPGDASYIAQPPIIHDYANIGAGAVLLPGVRIGAHACVAAGAIVTHDVPDYGFVRCEPARSFDRPEKW